MRIALKIYEKSGVLDDACKDWRKRPVAERTWALMQTFFTTANTERIRVISAQELGFATANAAREAALALAAAATPTTGGRNAGGGQPPNNNANNNNNNAGTTTGTSVGCYCWSHGLQWTASHTSATCTNQAEGHQAEATFGNMLGGNNVIRRKRGERPIYRKPERTQG